MASEPPVDNVVPPSAQQLVQVKVPLDHAADAFAQRDARGRIPIVIVPRRSHHVRNDILALAAAVLLFGIPTVLVVLVIAWLVLPVVLIAAVLVALAVFRSFLVRIPEGANGLLSRGGRYTRTIGSGTYRMPPWIGVSHLVTRREIPFDVPVVESPTRENVRVTVDTLLTFSIEEPHRFVFNISTDDFDQVLQASCQEALRSKIRNATVEEVLNFTQRDTDDLREMIAPDLESYGVRIQKIKITFAQPPAAFIQTQEERQLTVLQRAEQAEKQALAQQRQTERDTLDRQGMLARMHREQEELEIRSEIEEARQGLIVLQAASESLRLAKLDDRLQQFPRAAAYDWDSVRIDVARALAGNTRAILNIGRADDISQVLMVRDALLEGAPAQPAAADEVRDGTGSNPGITPPSQPIQAPATAGGSGRDST